MELNKPKVFEDFDLNNLIIHFKKSRSKYLKRCIEVCSSFTNFQINEDSYELHLSKEEVISNLKDVCFLVNRTRDWNGTEFYLDANSYNTVKYFFESYEDVIDCPINSENIFRQDFCKFSELFDLPISWLGSWIS